MAIFLKGSELNVALERLIREAEQCLFLISPYIKLHSRIKDELKHKRSSYKLEIIIVFGKCEEGQSNRINEEDLAFLKDFPNIQIRYERNLHAKYYASEDCGLITSMNLYDFSQNNNIEIGVQTKTPNALTGLVTSLVNTDKSLDFDSFRYFEQVIENSELLYHRVAHFEKGMFGLKETYVNSTVELDVIDSFFNKGYKKQENKFSGFKKFEKEEYKPNPTYQKQQEKGYCIRTGVEIPFDVQRPFCYQAYQTWAQFSNENYPENFCHKTGQPSNGKTSCKKPVLSSWHN